jgi:acetolactate synthase I/II/III large subunit
MVVDRAENVYPMIPAGAAHNEMKLSPDEGEDPDGSEDKGMVLV